MLGLVMINYYYYTTTVLRPSGFCPVHPGEPVPQETFTHSHLS